jgi:hypothetical protein
MGKLVTTTGDLLDAAFQHAQKMSLRGKDIQRLGRQLALENIEKLDGYRANLHENYLEGIREWRENYKAYNLGNTVASQSPTGHDRLIENSSVSKD